jgi:hypothetical protein
MVVAPVSRWVVCFYGFNVTPINLIKKRKYLGLIIVFIDVCLNAWEFPRSFTRGSDFLAGWSAMSG